MKYRSVYWTAAGLIGLAVAVGLAGCPVFPSGNEGEGMTEGEGAAEGEGQNEGETIDYRQAMRGFVEGISAYAKSAHPGFLVIPQNGEALLTSEGSPEDPLAQDYIGAIDGQGREDLFYGYDDDNEPTPAAAQEEMLGMMDLAEAQGVQGLVIDYCWTHSRMDNSYTSNAAHGFVSYAAEDRGVNALPSYPEAPYAQHAGDVTTLAGAKNMLYLLDPGEFPSREAYLSALEDTNFDLFVMDLFYNDAALTAQETARLHTKANGGHRLLVAYMSIGEAESYRYYWQSAWQTGNPAWLDAENPDWEGNYKVRYWEPEWQAVIFGGASAYLDRIIAAGFDGVYLDIIDAYEYFEEGR